MRPLPGKDTELDARDDDATPPPLVSVVTAVYNGERYLAECIEKVLAQTYPSWEYVIADNASTDRTFDIASSFAERDSRIRLHRFSTHVDVISSWNRALALVSPGGSYVKPVCADDWLFPQCLERMVALARRHPTVGIVSAYRLDGARVDLAGLPLETEMMPGREICRDSLLGGRDVFGSCTSLLYRGDLLRARGAEFFDEARLPPGSESAVQGRAAFVNFHADTGACYDLLRESDFGFVHQILTFSRPPDGESILARWGARIGTWLPGHLYILLNYGPVYLSRSDLSRRVETVRRAYQAMLLKKAIKGQLWLDGRARRYHRGALERLDVAFREAALSPGTGLRAFRALLRHGGAVQTMSVSPSVRYQASSRSGAVPTLSESAPARTRGPCGRDTKPDRVIARFTQGRGSR
jgi:glycosyltransferase involved in cell wall biosynthesis